MPSLSRRLILAAALAFAGLGAASAAPGVAASDDMSLGSPNAPVKVVEYASLSCPHCAHFNETVFPTLKAKYIDTGKVQYTLKELITPPDQVAAAGWLMARCAGPAKYFKVVDEVFRSQARWKQGQIKPVLVEVAKNNGMSEEQFQACLLDEKQLAGLQDRVERSALKDGVNATPTIYVNGKLVGGDQVPELAEVEAAIAAAQKSGGR